MKFLLFVAMATMAFLGCSDDSDSGVTGNGNDDKDPSTLVPGLGGDDDKPSDDKKEEIIANFPTYLNAVLEADVYDNMYEVKSAGIVFVVGDSALASVDPKSAIEFEVKLSYDFFMDKAEITQAQYYAIMGDSTKLPPSYGQNGVWKSMAQPVGNITLYNALVFCNKRSELKGLEPVYTITGDKSSFTVAIDYSKNGYALPTSAEWEFVAKNIVAPDGNKDYEDAKYLVSGIGDEPVSQKEIEALNGFVGYLGNIKEICLSDNLVHSTDSLLNAGIVAFEVSEEKEFVVMGGSYQTRLNKIVPSYRSSLECYKQLEDVGLRCVIRTGDVSTEEKLEFVPPVVEPPVVDTIPEVEPDENDSTIVVPPVEDDSTVTEE